MPMVEASTWWLNCYCYSVIGVLISHFAHVWSQIKQLRGIFTDFGITLFLSFEMQWMPGMPCVTVSWTQFAYLICMRASNIVTYQLRQHIQNDRVANVKGHGKLPSPCQFIILCFIFILMTFPAYVAYFKGCYTFYYLLISTVSSVSRQYYNCIIFI